MDSCTGKFEILWPLSKSEQFRTLGEYRSAKLHSRKVRTCYNLKKVLKRNQSYWSKWNLEPAIFINTLYMTKYLLNIFVTKVTVLWVLYDRLQSQSVLYLRVSYIFFGKFGLRNMFNVASQCNLLAASKVLQFPNVIIYV